MLAGSLQPLWEGFAERRWTEPQIGAFQALLEGFDLVADHTNAIRRIVRAYIERWGRISAGRPQLAPPSPRVGWPDPTPAQRLQPRAWWFDNCIQLYRAGEKAIAQADALDRRPRGNDVGEDLNGLPLDGDHNQVLLQGSWWGANPDSVDFAQTALNQAIIACALERYRLVTGAYPKNLEQLVPGYLRAIPPDILRGGPMLYERTEAGRYILRGVGPNGISEQNKKGSDDWLWAYPEPTNAPPTPTVANPR